MSYTYTQLFIQLWEKQILKGCHVRCLDMVDSHPFTPKPDSFMRDLWISKFRKFYVLNVLNHFWHFSMVSKTGTYPTERADNTECKMAACRRCVADVVVSKFSHSFLINFWLFHRQSIKYLKLNIIELIILFILQ